MCGPLVVLLALEPADDREDLVQEPGDPLERAAVVEQAGDCAEQVAQQVAGTLLGGDVEHDLIEVHDQEVRSRHRISSPGGALIPL